MTPSSQTTSVSLHDTYDREYRLAVVADERWLNGVLWHNRQAVGHVSVVFRSPDEWELADIFICEDVPVRVGLLHRLWLYCMRQQPTRHTYRNRGLGTAIIHFVTERARQHQVKYICGRVVHKDNAARPELLRWYESNGFTVIPRCDDDAFDTIAHIRKVVAP